MIDIKGLLEVRRKLKGKKPVFFAQDSHKRKEVKKRWRRPIGLHSKMRLNKKGYPRKISKGWRSPKLVRYFHGKGYKMMMAHNAADLERIDNKTEAVIISSKVGAKKKIQIIEMAKSRDIQILNYNNVNEYLKKINEKLLKSKEKKAEKTEESKKEKESEKKIKEKKDDSLAEKIISEEEKKEQKKKEMDKILTKKDV